MGGNTYADRPGLAPTTQVGAWISVGDDEPFWVPVVPKERVEVQIYDPAVGRFVRGGG